MKKTLIISIAVLALAACTKEAPVADNSAKELQFNIGMADATRATATAFEAQDSISLYAVEYDGSTQMPLQIGGNYLNNEKLTYNGTSWAASGKLYWSANACDFYALCPYQPSISSIESYPFTIATDQTGAGYAKSDLMYASSENVSYVAGTTEAVDLQFSHMMSKVVVKIVKGSDFDGDIPDDVVAHIYNTNIDCTVDLSKGSVGKDAFGSKKTITMKKVSNEEFEAIVVPQNLEKKTPLVELTMGGIAYLLETSLSFRAGYVHTITLTVNTSPDQEQIEIAIDASTGSWSSSN